MMTQFSLPISWSDEIGSDAVFAADFCIGGDAGFAADELAFAAETELSAANLWFAAETESSAAK